jgi:hypothetical protein
MAIDFGTILGGVLTGGAGGLLGIIGNIGNTWLSMKQQKQQNDYNLAMLPLQLNADIERTKADVAKVQEQGASAAFVASQEADKLDGRESPWAANIKAMVRPCCLVMLGLATTAIFTAGNPTESMKEYIIQNVITDFSMAVSWYFGARATALVMQGFKTKAGN